MDDRELAEKLLTDHFTATAALIALMLKNLPDEVRTRTLDAVRNGTCKVGLRTRVESSETALVLVLARLAYSVLTCVARRRLLHELRQLRGGESSFLGPKAIGTA